MSQTVVKQLNKIVFGSGKFEISEDGLSWIDLGAMKNIVFSETFEKVKILSDNAGVIKERIKNHFASLSGDLQELDLANLNTIRGGIDNYSTVAGVSETLKTGGKVEITPILCRVTNENEAGEQFRITICKASNNKGIVINFNPDDADDPNMINIELEGTPDTSKIAGEQLFEIYNEQGESASS